MVSESSSEATAMAMFQWSLPEKFSFRMLEEWSRWTRRFKRFCQASVLTSKGKESQVKALVYIMGNKVDNILHSFHLSKEDSKKYSNVKKKVWSLLWNIIYEGAKFNQREQQPNESVDTFITDLHSLAEFCDYRAFHDKLICDRIVVGIQDWKLSADGSNRKCCHWSLASEAVTQLQPTLHSQQDATNSIAAISRGGTSPRNKQFSHTKRHSDSNKSCTRCGKSPPHSKEQCPGKEITCKKCHKEGHFQTICRKNVQSQNGGWKRHLSGSNLWHRSVIAMDYSTSPLEFKIDTGADVTAIPETKYNDKRDGLLQQTTYSLDTNNLHQFVQ